jgi:hypothetical protein
LPKVLSSFLLSPHRGERIRVRGDKEKTFGTEYKSCLPETGQTDNWYSNNLARLKED